jgi:hypothetical protein
VWNQTLHQVAWFSALPQDLFVFIGVCEFLGEVGLILPAMTRSQTEAHLVCLLRSPHASEQTN